ncbi:hypothetical protein [Actinomadura fibrosa]|uniref:Uncharacterized protein n=1 Tax=Actinomadura fibrosa TaxID=111802 RepID=A0ABW2XCG0_9ACTN|nr:hypothetical protein [Actinomadura fibrosa]
MTGVPVAWAVLGKDKGSYDDYSITSGGGGLSGKQLPVVFAELSSLGEPSAAEAGPGALPWIVFTAVRAGGRDYIGLGVQHWTPDCDAMGRPIMACAFYYVPYEEARNRRVSYRELLSAVQGAPLPDDGSALRAGLAGTAPERLAETIGLLGFDRVAAAAALLLERPVTVTRAEHLTTDQRLSFMDAVAALLPHGWRTRFSAATWNEAAEVRIGLAFGASCRPGSLELDWQDPGAPPPAAAPRAAAYLAWLHELVGPRAWTHARLVAALARRGAPMFDDEPETAVAILRDLDWPETVHRAVQAGTAAHGDIVALFAGRRHREYADSATTMRMFDALVDAADPDELPLVAELWHECGGGQAALVRNARRRLWREPPGTDLDAYARTADRIGLTDAFLAGLITAPDPPYESTGGEAVLAALLKKHRPPATGLVPKALGAHTSVLAELLLALTPALPSNRQAWLAAVEPYAPETLLGAFRALWDGRPPAPAAFDELARSGDLCVPAVLRTAARCRILGPTLEAFGDWLMAGVGGTASGQGTSGWTALLTGLECATPAEKGTIDGLLIWLGDEPRHLAESGSESTYFAAFHTVCSAPAGLDGRPRMYGALRAFLARYAWVADQAPAVVHLVRNTLDGDPAIARTVLLGRSVAPRLDGIAAFNEWREGILTVHPTLREEEPLLLVRNVRPDAPPEVVGEVCAEALHRGLQPAQVCDEVIAAGWRLSGDRLIPMLDQVASTLMRSGRSRDAATSAALELGRGLLLRCSPELAREIRQHAVWYALRETHYRLETVRALTEIPGRRRRHPIERGARRELRRLARAGGRLARPGLPLRRRA